MKRPWEEEPDRLDWITAAGFPAIILRGPVKSLCGYVGVSIGHPWYRTNESNISAQVHGGLTFGGMSDSFRFSPTEDLSDPRVAAMKRLGVSIWWLGFDTAHSGDLVPSLLDYGMGGNDDDTYRTIDYVRRECEQLAAQARAVAPKRRKVRNRCTS